jgi:hypothetical protein
MAGFGKDQMAALDPTAMAGFGATQMAALDATAMAGFGKDQMAALDATAMAGLGKDQMAALAPTAMAGFGATQMAALDKDAMGGLKANQMAQLDATAMAGLGKDQMAALDPNAMGGFGATQMAALDPTAMGGLKATQMAALDPTAMAGLDATQIAALDPTAMGGLDDSQMAALSSTAMAGFGADQMAGLDSKALGGISTDQFSALPPAALGGLKSENLGGIPPDVVANMSIDDLQNLDPDEVKGMKDIAKLVTNLNEFSVDTDTVAALLPDGWAIDPSGDLTAPPGAEISFKTLEKPAVVAAGKPAIPALPNLDSSLALGAGSGAPTVLTGMDNALAAAVPGTDLGFTQTASGVLNIGSGDGGPPVASFIPDADNMVQAAADAVPGVSVDAKTGGFVLVTDQGYQIPLKPSISNPDEVAALLPDSKVVIGAGGQTSIEDLPGPDGTVTSIAGIPSPILTTDDRPPGVYTDGVGVDAVVTIVGANNSAQTLSPAIKDPEAFNDSINAIDGVEDLVQKVDGTVELKLGGAPLKLKPSLTITKAEPPEGSLPGQCTPGVVIEDGRFFMISANCDKQEFAAVQD